MNYALYVNIDMNPCCEQRRMLSEIAYVLEQDDHRVLLVNHTSDDMRFKEKNVEAVEGIDALLAADVVGVFCELDSQKPIPYFVEECRDNNIKLWSLNNKKTYDRVVDWVGEKTLCF